MYQELTKYISSIKKDIYGEWIVDRVNNGSPEHPIQMPFVNYTERVSSFVKTVYLFIDEHPEPNLHHYYNILSENNINLDSDDMIRADLSKLNGDCLMALIVGAIRADRFCEGALLEFFNNGRMLTWLRRLNDIDEQKKALQG